MADHPLIGRGEITGEFKEMLGGGTKWRILLVSGKEKMGKSRLMREFRDIGRANLAHTALVKLDSKLLSYSDILHEICTTIGMDLFQKYNVTHSESPKQKVELSGTHVLSSQTIIAQESREDENKRRQRLTAAFIEDLRALPTDQRVVLLFDAFEQADQAIQDWVLNTLVAPLYNLPTVFVVCAGRQMPNAPEKYHDICISRELEEIEDQVFVEYSNQHKFHIRKDVNQELISDFVRLFRGKPGFFIELLMD